MRNKKMLYDDILAMECIYERYKKERL